MKNFIEDIEDIKSPTDLMQVAKLLISSYDPFMPQTELWQMLGSFFPKNICNQYSKKIHGHRVINDLIFKYYPCERVIKYHLIKERLSIADEVTIFEMPINNSRLDVGRVNGSSYVYEIKTKYDSLTKLEKQVEDYSKAFEYICVVVDERHVEKAHKILPPHCGILTYDNEINFYQLKPAEYSPFVETETQLATLTSQDIAVILKETGIKKPPGLRAERVALLQQICSSEQIKSFYKWIIKKKYTDRWEYLRQTFDRIQPVDIQVVYQTSADPFWLYYKN